MLIYLRSDEVLVSEHLQNKFTIDTNGKSFQKKSNLESVFKGLN